MSFSLQGQPAALCYSHLPTPALDLIIAGAASTQGFALSVAKTRKTAAHSGCLSVVVFSSLLQ